MSAPVVATAAAAQTRQKSSNAIHRGADAIMTLLSDEIGKVTHHYEQEIQGLHRQLSTVISVSETASSALDLVCKERDNAVADALQTKEAMVKAIEQKDALQRELQDAAAQQKSAEVAATQSDIFAWTHEALLHSHRKDKLARDALVDKLTSDFSTVTDERDTIRAEKVKAEAEAAAKETALQTLRREMDACMSDLRQSVSRVEMERDTALAEVAGMKETVTHLQSSVASLEAERDSARVELDSKSGEAEALRQTQTYLKEAAATAEAERDTATRKLTERLAAFELAAASLTTERDGAMAEVQKQREELSTRATRISKLESETKTTVVLKDLQEKLAGQGATLIQRDGQLSQLRDSHTKTLAKLSQLEAEKEESGALLKDLHEKHARQVTMLTQRDQQILQLKETHMKDFEKLATAMSDEKVRVKHAEEGHKKRLHQRDGTISRMQISTNRLNAELATAQSAIERLQSEKQTVEDSLQSAVAERNCADQKEELARKDAIISQRDEQISRLKQSSTKTRTKLEATRTALADEKSGAQKAEDAHTILLGERDATISGLQTRLDADLASAQSEISRLKSEKKTIEGVLQTVVAERARAEATIATHVQQLSERDDQITRLQDKNELPTVWEKAKSLESALTQANEEKDGLSLKASRLQGEVDRLQVKLVSTHESASDKQAADAVLQRVVAERALAETAVKSLTSERDELKTRLAAFEADMKAVHTQASTMLEHKLCERDQRITELENGISALKTHITHLQSSATDEKSRLERQLESADSERSTAQSTVAALKQQVQDLSSKFEPTTPQEVSATQRQVKALTEERDALRKEKVTAAQRAAERMAALTEERETLVRKVRERDEAIEKVRVHIPPQFVALETQVRTLEAERNALQAEARSVEAIMAALRDIGLDFSAPDNTFSLGENCVPQLTHLIDLGQKVQEMCQDLSVAQGDLTNDAEATILSLDSLHPFSLLSFFTIVDDWLTAAVATGDGWEKLYREKLQESVKLREQRNRDKARVEKTEKLERSLKAKSDEFIQFKAALQKEGIVYDDKTEHGFVFAGKALECVREIAPFVVKVHKTGKAMHEVHPELGIEGLLKAPDTNPRLPMGVLKQMRKWIAVAQRVSEVAWDKCLAHEGDMKQAKRRNATLSSTPSSKPKSMPTPLSIRPTTTRDSQAGSSSPLSMSSPLTDITTRTAKRPSQPTASSSQSARALEPPKKKRKIQESSSSSSEKVQKEEEEDGLTRLARVFSSDGGRSAPQSSSAKAKRPKPPSNAKPPSSKGQC